MTERDLHLALEPAQLSERRRVPLGRRELGPGIKALLWALRVYVVIAVALVVYSFIRALQGS